MRRSSKRATRIVLLSVSLNGGGGIASFARQIVGNLVRLCEKGVVSHLEILSLYAQGESSWGGNGFVRGKAFGGQRAWFGARVVWEAVRGSTGDWILADHVGMLRPLAFVPGFLVGPRVAVLLHGEELPRLRRGTARASWRHVDVAITNSSATRRKLHGVLGAAYKTAHVMNPSVEECYLKLASRMGGDGAREPTALIVGRMWSSQSGKGHRTVLEAWKTVVGVRPGSRLYVVGCGDALEDYQRLTTRFGLDGVVEFTGEVGDELLAEIYGRSWVYVMPSKQDGYGISFLQAMLHGVPCIGPRDGGAEDLIIHGVNGLLVDPDDVEGLAGALLQVFGDSVFRREMSRNALRVGRSKALYDGDACRIAEALGLAGNGVQVGDD